MATSNVGAPTRGLDQTLKRLAPLTGVAFVVLYVAAAVVAYGDAPDFADRDVDAIVTYYDEEKTSVLAGTLLVSLSAPLFLWWASCLRSGIARAEGGTGRLATVAFGSAAAAAAIGVSASLVNAMGAFRFEQADAIDPAAATVYFDISLVLFGAAAQIAAAAILLASGVAALRYRAVMPPWLALVSVVIGLAMLIPAVSYVALAAALLWVVGVSGLLYAQRAGEV